MKKILFAIFMSLFLIVNVNAATNKLYFNEKDNKLYYDSTQLDQQVFLNHPDMIPGQEFTDELLIENGTNTKYDLYLKARKTELTNEFLDHVLLSVYVDDKEVYNGTASGMVYEDDGTIMEDAIFIGTYDAKSNGKLIVKSMLEPEYEVEEEEESRLQWDFYGDYELGSYEPIVPEVPETNDSILKYIIMFIVGGLLIIGGLILIIRNKDKKSKK